MVTRKVGDVRLAIAGTNPIMNLMNIEEFRNWVNLTLQSNPEIEE